MTGDKRQDSHRLTDHLSPITHHGGFMSASILIVDDEEPILTSLSSILRDEGYEVAVAKNGVEALRVYTMDPPDLMLLDIWMPGMDGMEALRRVRELVPTAQVMMMSGHGSIETAVKAIAGGVMVLHFMADAPDQRPAEVRAGGTIARDATAAAADRDGRTDQ